MGGLWRYFSIIFYGGRFVLSHFQADYHLGGSRRGGLGRSDCIHNRKKDEKKIDACHEKTDLKVFVKLSYQKKDGHVWPRQSFYWYDTDF